LKKEKKGFLCHIYACFLLLIFFVQKKSKKVKKSQKKSKKVKKSFFGKSIGNHFFQINFMIYEFFVCL
jgi:hypothetical protein